MRRKRDESEVTPGGLVKALRKVPETRLSIIELTWKVAGKDGSLKPETVAFHRKEIDQAVDQAEAYAKETKETVSCLIRIGSTSSL